MLQDENFQLENYNRDLEKPVIADRDESKKYKQHMLKFIENLMWTFHMYYLSQDEIMEYNHVWIQRFVLCQCLWLLQNNLITKLR